MSFERQRGQHSAANSKGVAWHVSLILVDDGNRTSRLGFDDLLERLRNGQTPQALQLVTPRHCGANAITGNASINQASGTVQIACTGGDLAGRAIRLYTTPAGVLYGMFVD